MMIQRIRLQSGRRDRRGVIAPLVAVSLLAVMGCVALVLDRLWLEAAMVELRTCAEAAALAAAGELANDDALRSDADPVSDRKRNLSRARRIARRIAARNRVAGEAVILNTDPKGDVRFGRLILRSETGRTQFLETNLEPTSVLVTALRTRSRGNPVALFIRGLTGQLVGNVAAYAEATIDNRVVGIRPFDGCPAPVLPLAILQRDSSGQRTTTWNMQIDRRAGQDRFTYDRQSGEVLPRPDGIPEIVLSSISSDQTADEANVQLIELGTNIETDRLLRQIQRGWTVEDLETTQGELRFDGRPIDLHCTAVIPTAVQSQLATTTGQNRICLLYTQHEATGRLGSGRIRCTGMVAGRVMAVSTQAGGACRIVFQPGVLTTRTAILADRRSRTSGDRRALANPYIYKLHLTQ